VATIKSAESGAEVVSIKMPQPSAITEYEIDGMKFNCINTGVPHAVTFSEKTYTHAEVYSIGRSVRYNSELFPEGTNVDFVSTVNQSFSRYSLHTYERGVEAETEACGTGATASALVMIAWFGAISPVRFEVLSGDTLEVTASFDANATSFTDVFLTGPARFVSEGFFDTLWYA
jgi:diaminopimelate epimerase